MSHVIHIVDDDASTRNSLAFLLITAGYAVRTHDNGNSFLGNIATAAPACLIADLNMPDMTGVNLIKAVKAHDHTIPAIVITGHSNVPNAVAAMKAGAADFIEKPFSDDTILQAIKDVCAPAISGSDGSTTPDEFRKRLQALTARERQVLDAIVDGLPNKSIAYNLDISPRTVEIHRANLMSKLQTRNLPQLVRLVLSAAEN